jgi:hypothetical protein
MSMLRWQRLSDFFEYGADKCPAPPSFGKKLGRQIDQIVAPSQCRPAASLDQLVGAYAIPNSQVFMWMSKWLNTQRRFSGLPSVRLLEAAAFRLEKLTVPWNRECILQGAPQAKQSNVVVAYRE